ncbi:MAG: PP2C family serine/threonine-protein phosphatase [Caldilineaceae bacterium]
MAVVDGGAPWRVVAASVRGTSHLRTATPCQDAHAYCTLADGTLLLAVADGAGSASHGGDGAQLAVSTALKAVQDALAKYQPTSRKAWSVLLHHAFCQARTAIRQHAAQNATIPRHFSSTLLLLILTENEVICGLVGDCAAVVQHVDGTLISLCPPQRGEYANTTNFIVQQDLTAILDLRFYVYPVRAAALHRRAGATCDEFAPESAI